MTWNPLKKTHLTTKPSLAPQVIPKQQDRELETIFYKLQTLEESTRKIQKEVKRYVEGMINLHKCEIKLSVDLSNIPQWHQDTDLCNLLEEYLSVTSQIAETVQDGTKICQKAVTEPLKRFGGEFAGIYVALQKRETALQEFFRQEGRARKIEEKESTAANVLKREQARKTVQQAKEEVIAIHDRLLAELPKFYDFRMEYFTPCLQALVRAQGDYHGNIVRLFTHLTNMSDRPATPYLEPDHLYEARLQQRLTSLQALTIVRHPPTLSLNPAQASPSSQ